MKHLFLSCSAGLLLLPVSLLGLGAGLALGGCAGRETLSEGDLKVKLLQRQSRNEGSAAATPNCLSGLLSPRVILWSLRKS